MTSRVPLRILFTYDLFGSFAPFPTSYGSLPGARALEAHIDTLREDAHASYWIDGGDFSAGGVLGPETDHALSWAAAGALSIDAAVAGNHEFDFGDQRFDEQWRRLPFRCLSVDLEYPEEPFVLEPPGGPRVAVLGLTFPERRGRSAYAGAADHAAAANRVRSLATELRPSVDVVVLAMHEGMPGATQRPDDTSVARFCASMAPFVDAILGAHTMSRALTTIADIPYLQPWPLGTEVAVLDVHPRHLHPWLSPVRGRREWSGPGALLQDEAQADTVAETRRALTAPAVDGSTHLSAATAAGVRELTSAHIALIPAAETTWMQPRLDGLGGYIAPGPVTRAHIDRALPWSVGEHRDQLWGAELATHQVQILTDDTVARFGPIAVSRTDRNGLTVIPSTRVDAARTALGDTIEWRRLDHGTRAGLARYLQRTAGEPPANTDLIGTR